MEIKTIVVYHFKDGLPAAYIMDGDHSEYDGSTDELNVHYNDDESKNGLHVRFEIIPKLIKLGLANDIEYKMICVGES